jgi:exonuclease VII large subunit
MTRGEENQQLVTAADQLKAGDRIRTRFSSGDVVSRVEEVNTDSGTAGATKPEEE